MKKIDTTKLCVVFIVAFMFVVPVPGFADGTSQAKILEIKGEANFQKSGTTDWAKLESTTILQEGDSIKTGPDGMARLECMGNSKTAELLVRNDTEFKFTTFRYDEVEKIDNTLLNIGVGSVLVKAEKLVGASRFELKTPTTIVGVRGTIFEVHVPKAE